MTVIFRSQPPDTPGKQLRQCQSCFHFSCEMERPKVSFRESRLSDGMRRPVSPGCDTLPTIDTLKTQWKRDPLGRRLARGRGKHRGVELGAKSRAQPPSPGDGD